MKSKECFKCGVEKPLSEFYKHKYMADGHLGKCKECTKSYIRNYYQENREKVRAYDAERKKRPERKEQKLGYQKKRRVSHPEKAKANRMVGNAIRDGRLVRLPCEKCGDPKSEGHHDDYSKPLEVRWLCFKHHREHHGQRVG